MSVYTLSTGTPNEQVDVKTGSLADVGRKALQILVPMKTEADKFDKAAFEQIRSLTEELRREVRHAHSLKINVGDKRSWRFDYMGVTFVINIRRVS